MVEAIFFDIDGTLIVPFADKLSEDTLYCLKELRKKGIKLFISTGRPYIRINWIKELFDFDGYVTFNGQCVVDNNDNFIKLQNIDEDDVFNAIKYCEDNKIGLCVYELDKSYKNSYADPYKKDGWLDIKNAERGHKYYQMLLFASGEKMEKVVAQTRNIKTTSWNNLTCDMILKTGGKEKGIETILDYYNIDKENTMVFGDGGNDIDMLKFCKIGVAMGNSRDDVKQAADYVTSDEDKPEICG